MNMIRNSFSKSKLYTVLFCTKQYCRITLANWTQFIIHRDVIRYRQRVVNITGIDSIDTKCLSVPVFELAKVFVILTNKQSY